MATTRPPMKIEFGVNYPAPQDLRTGDLLFARPPLAAATAPSRQLFSMPLELDFTATMTVREFIGPALLESLGLGPAEAGAATDRVLFRESFDVADLLRDRNRFALLMAVLKLEFGELVQEWLGLTVKQFLARPLARVLLGAFEGELDTGFFVGHCAMALRIDENGPTDGDRGEVFVLEANATSFANHGVHIVAYHRDDDPVHGTARSWAAARARRGDVVWHARHEALAGGDEAAARQIRAALVEAAQSYEGRKYSFFESSTLGNPDRLYCSELLYVVLRDAAALGLPVLPVDDRRDWAWLRAQHAPGTAMRDAIDAVWSDPAIRPPVSQRRFFILTVQMLWRSARLRHLLQPDGDYDRA